MNPLTTQKDLNEVLSNLQSDADHGLSEEEAQRRLAQNGPNRMTAQRITPAWRKFLDQLIQPLVVVLIFAAVVSALLGHTADALAIFVVVLVNAAIGFLQEYRAEKAISALDAMIVTEASVVRQGKPQRIPSEQLVIGDVVQLASGDSVPADLRLLQTRDLQVEEAALTGESIPVSKEVGTLPVDAVLGDRVNMAYAGTAVTFGRGGALVRKLPAVETLGSTTVVCSDKTGTLTENAMTVTRFWTGGVEFEVSGVGYDPRCEALVLLAALVVGTALPVLPVQILWVNMATALLLGVALVFEPKEPGLMDRSPRPVDSKPLDWRLVARTLVVSVMIAGATFGLFEWSLSERGESIEQARTIAVNTIVVIEAAYLFACRSLRHPLWNIGFFSNPWVWLGSGMMLLAQLVFTYAPVMNTLFHTSAIAWDWWLYFTIAGFIVLASVETYKVLALQLHKKGRTL